MARNDCNQNCNYSTDCAPPDLVERSDAPRWSIPLVGTIRHPGHFEHRLVLLLVQVIEVHSADHGPNIHVTAFSNMGSFLHIHLMVAERPSSPFSGYPSFSASVDHAAPSKTSQASLPDLAPAFRGRLRPTHSEHALGSFFGPPHRGAASLHRQRVPWPHPFQRSSSRRTRLQSR
jgi:hypothetical protein